MGLHKLSTGAATLQAQTDNTLSPSRTTRLAVGWLLRHQGNEATLLVVQHQVGVAKFLAIME